MSGDGIVSVRFPLTLLGLFRASAESQGLTIHEAAQRLVLFIPDLTLDEFERLKEPPREVSNPRVSLYIGWRGVDALASATQKTTLGNSNIFRRLLYGLLVTKEIEFVQQNGRWKLRFASQENRESSISTDRRA